MGVDFSAHFGLGYKIECPIDEENESTYRGTLDGIMDNMYDFSKYVRSSSKYLLLEVGSIYENEMEWYIFIKYPFDYGFDLTKEIEKLTDYCKNMEFKTVGNFGCYGGLYIS